LAFYFIQECKHRISKLFLSKIDFSIIPALGVLSFVKSFNSKSRQYRLFFEIYTKKEDVLLFNKKAFKENNLKYKYAKRIDCLNITLLIKVNQ
jgi:hypothetical protein